MRYSIHRRPSDLVSLSLSPPDQLTTLLLAYENLSESLPIGSHICDGT